jgi:4-amino-4-deoxy-L-arabinose transferase-like glycosyltransferase
MSFFDPIACGYNTLIVCAVGAAIELPLAFNTMPNNATPTVGARRSKLVNGALKAIKPVAPPRHYNLKAFIVFIVTGGALAHRLPFLNVYLQRRSRPLRSSIVRRIPRIFRLGTNSAKKLFPSP